MRGVALVARGDRGEGDVPPARLRQIAASAEARRPDGARQAQSDNRHPVEVGPRPGPPRSSAARLFPEEEIVTGTLANIGEERCAPGSARLRR